MLITPSTPNLKIYLITRLTVRKFNKNPLPMKFIRHDCLAIEDPRIKSIMSIGGHTAYGVWNHLLEIIGNACDSANQLFACLPIEQWCERIRLTLKEFKGYISLFKRYDLISCERIGEGIKIGLLNWELGTGKEDKLLSYGGDLTQNFFLSDIYPKMKEFGLRPEDVNDVEGLYSHCVGLMNTAYGDGTSLYGWDEIMTAWDHYTQIQIYNKSEDK